MKKSDIKIDNNFTTVANVPLCKQSAADFCARFTDGDIVRAIAEAADSAGKYVDSTADIVSLSAEIYCSAPIMASDSDVMLTIRLFLFSWSSAWRIIAYCDSNLNIKPDLLQVTYFSKAD